MNQEFTWLSVDPFWTRVSACTCLGLIRFLILSLLLHEALIVVIACGSQPRIRLACAAFVSFK